MSDALEVREVRVVGRKKLWGSGEFFDSSLVPPGSTTGRAERLSNWCWIMEN